MAGRRPGRGRAGRAPDRLPVRALRQHGGRPSATPGAVCVVIDPDGVRTERLPVRVELAGTWSRGRTIVDRRDWSGRPGPRPARRGAGPWSTSALAVDGPALCAGSGSTPSGRGRRDGPRRRARLAQRRPRHPCRAAPAAGRDRPRRRGRCAASPAARAATRRWRRPRPGPGWPWSARVGDGRGGARLPRPPALAGSRRLRGAGRAGAPPTGTAWITVDDDGENSIVVIPGANADLTLEDLEPVSDLGPGDVLLVQLEVPCAVVAAAARRAHGRGRGSWSTPRRMPPCRPTSSALADPVVVNEHEALALADSDVVPRSVLVTFGGERVRAGTESGRRRRGTRGAGGRHHRGRRRVLRRAGCGARGRCRPR